MSNSVVDLGEYVLLNVYAPNAYLDDPERYLFKLKYQYLLSVAVNKLLGSGRAVVRSHPPPLTNTCNWSWCRSYWEI